MGAFVGIQQMEYASLAMPFTASLGPYTATGGPLSVAAGRISFTYGIKGPALSIDTACSSSLVATHVAMQHVQVAQQRSALAAGINLLLSETTTAVAQAAGMLTMDGRCKALDQGADGYVRYGTHYIMPPCDSATSSPNNYLTHVLDSRAESCTAYLLNHDPPNGEGSVLSLASTFVNQDGRSSSLTAPNGPSQQALIRGALAAAELLPQLVQGLALHGTGTSLGDPIEVGAALAVLGSGVPTLRLTAAKSRVGHSQAAAGASGIAHAAVQLAHARSDAIMHLRSMNPLVSSLVQAHVAAASSPLLLPRQDGQYATTSPLAICNVSAFAFQGTNAHAVLCKRAPPSSAKLTAAHSTFSQLWQRRRLWFAPHPHALLGRLTKAAWPVVELASLLTVARHAYLLDHKV